MYFACRGPASTSSTSTIVSVLVIFGHGYSRRRLRTFLPLHLTIVRVSIFFFRFGPPSTTYLSTTVIFLIDQRLVVKHLFPGQVPCERIRILQNRIYFPEP